MAMIVGFVASTAYAQGARPDAAKVDTRRFLTNQSFGGPASVGAQLEEDAADKEPAFQFHAIDRALEPWFEWKKKLQEDHGFAFSIAYTGLYQNVISGAPDGVDDDAGSGILRLSGKWTLFGRDSNNKGALVWSVDQRHSYTDAPPSGLGFSTGYLGIPGVLFSDIDLVLGDLNWQQGFNDGKGGLIVGRYDPNDFFDVLGYANPWTTFQNLAILFNPSIALADWSTGLGVGHWFNNQWMVSAAVNDVNGTATDIKLFEDTSELYLTGEIGWSPSREERYLKNIHVTLWHADEREEDGIEESNGVAIGANWTWNEQWMLFSRLGWSDGTAPLYNETVTLGMLYSIKKRTDLFGIAGNWGSPSDETLDEQITAEMFYRFQLAENMAITPSVQYIHDPALNPEEDSMWILGVRARITF
jgi:porin